MMSRKNELKDKFIYTGIEKVMEKYSRLVDIANINFLKIDDLNFEMDQFERMAFELFPEIIKTFPVLKEKYLLKYVIIGLITNSVELIESLLSVINENENKNLNSILWLYFYYLKSSFDFFFDRYVQLKNLKNELSDKEKLLFDLIVVIFFLKLNVDNHQFKLQTLSLSKVILKNKYICFALYNYLLDHGAFGTIDYLSDYFKENDFYDDELIKLSVSINPDKDFYEKGEGYLEKITEKLARKYIQFNGDINLIKNFKQLILNGFFKTEITLEKLKFSGNRYLIIKRVLIRDSIENSKRLILNEIGRDPGFKYYYPLLCYLYAKTKDTEKLKRIEFIFSKYFKIDNETAELLAKSFFLINDSERVYNYLNKIDDEKRKEELKKLFKFE